MILAKLFVLKQEIELLSTDMRYVRRVESNGEMDTEVLGGHITVCFATRDDTDMILRWMTKGSGGTDVRKADNMEEGKICFYDEGFDYPPTKTYEFDDALVTYYNESMNTESGIPLQTTVTISPAIQNYGVELIKSWNVSYIEPTDDIPYQPLEVYENTSPRINETYYEDADGNKIRELKIGTDVYLVIKSENISGKTVNIDLSDKKNDFIYKGEHLENDILKDLTITSDIQKEKLTVVAQHHD
ncbi:MAG: hypothetical protein HRT58_11030 [Crocinitomicaceae bacterium]|nr:hypothetical protein [Flavobacteriales bacterium]NQZ36189.1 hypothetical protein [Crocinitomicaceae bacterium]